MAAGIYIWSDNTAIPALDMGGAFPGGLTLINKGFIMGKGGDGGYLQANRTTYLTPTPGGPAMTLTGPISIDNAAGYIGGGGGGGAGQSGKPEFIFSRLTLYSPGGGGAGGGRGGPANNGDVNGTSLSGFGIGGATGHGRLDLVGAGQTAVVIRAATKASFDLDAVAGAKVAAGARAKDRFTVTRRGAGNIAVVGDAARRITVTGQSVLRVNSRALAQPVLAPNLQATGASGLQGKLSAQAVQPDGACRASMTVNAALHDGYWPLTLLALGVRAPPGQRRFTPPDTAQGGSIITVPRSGILRAEPRAGRILKG